MSTPPQITTIIPTYRRPKHVARAIRSALAQTYPHIRVCVYDNASGDETGDVVRAIAAQDPRVEYVERSENIGPVANMTDGMRRVETPYLSLLTDDDYLLPNFYEQAIVGFAEYPDVAFVACATIYVDVRHRILFYPVGTWSAGYYPSPDGARLMFERGDFSLISSVYRRDIIDEVGPLNPNEKDLMEISWHTRIASQRSFAFLEKPGTVYVQSHPGRSAFGQSLSERAEELLSFYHRQSTERRFTTSDGGALHAALQRYVAVGLASLGVLAVASGDADEIAAVEHRLQELWLADARASVAAAVRRADRIPGYRWALGFADRHLLRLRWVKREVVHWRRAAHLKRELGPYIDLLGPPIPR